MLCSAAREETPAGINGGLRASCPMGQVRRTARRGRRPAVERSGTNALGVRRPVSAAAPRCKAPAGRGCRRRRLGKRNCRAISLPPSALRAATSLAEGGKGKRIPTPVCALARNDRGTGRTGSSAPTEWNKSRAETGRRGRRPLRSDRETGWTESSAPTERNKSRAETGRRGRRPLRSDRGTGRTGSSAPTMCNRGPSVDKSVRSTAADTFIYKCGWVQAYL